MKNKGEVGTSSSYRGEVKISLRRHNKIYNTTVYNAGTINLFQLIPKLLADTTMVLDDGNTARPYSCVPSHIDFRASTEQIDEKTRKFVLTEHTLLNNPVPVLKETTYSDNKETGPSGTLTLTSEILSLDVRRDTEMQYKEFKLVVLGHVGYNTPEVVLAEVVDNSGALSTLYTSFTEDTDAIVEWKMIFSNDTTKGD